MFTYDAIAPPVRRALAAWLGRLAGRLADLKDQVRDGVVEAAGRTAAEAAEVALRAAFGVGLPPPRARPPGYPDWGDPGDDPWIDDAAEPDVAPRPGGPRLSWQAAAAAGLHALAWWLRRATHPLLTAAAAVAGAALLLLD